MKRGKDLDTFKPKPKKEEGELDELIGAIQIGIAGYIAGKPNVRKKKKKKKKKFKLMKLLKQFLLLLSVMLWVKKM